MPKMILDPKIESEDVLKILQWLESQPHLPKITATEASWFFQSCYYSSEVTKNTIDTYFTMKTLSPELFLGRNTFDSNFQMHLKLCNFSFLEEKTPENYTICLVKFFDTNPDHFNLAQQLKVFDMATLLHLKQNGPMEGLLICLDLQDVVFAHFTKLGIIPIKKFLFYLQDAMPIRLKGLHFFNIVPFMDKILALMRPFMKKDLMDMLYLHEKTDGLFEFFPRKCLPSDFQGNAPSLKKLHEQQVQNMLENNEFFLRQDKQLVDESKRPGKPKSASEIFGVDGSFKKLEYD